MKLEAGNIYLDRNGDKIHIVDRDEDYHPDYPFIDSNGDHYAENGNYCDVGIPSCWDLIEKVST